MEDLGGGGGKRSALLGGLNLKKPHNKFRLFMRRKSA